MIFIDNNNVKYEVCQVTVTEDSKIEFTLENEPSKRVIEQMPHKFTPLHTGTLEIPVTPIQPGEHRKCQLCEKRFKDTESLEKHMGLHTYGRGYNCDVCGKSFSAKSFLKVHMMIHTGEKPFVCEICNKGFSRSSNLKAHHLTHTKEKPFKCDYCEKVFTHPSNMKKHISSQHSEGRPYKCEYCDKSYKLSKHLRRHVLVHNVDKDKVKYACNICDKLYSSKEALIRHRKQHKVPPPTAASDVSEMSDLVSEELFTDENGILQVKREVVIPPENVQIEIPSPGVPPSPVKLVPKRVVNTMMKCEHCTKRFVNQVDLDKHMTLHTGERPHKCLVCHKAFNAKSFLKVHMATHSSEKPFKCDVCGKGFNRPSNLKAHRITHDNPKPYPCHICGKMFSHPSNVQKHIRIHTDERPYQCEYCDKNFRQSKHLSRHMLIHTSAPGSFRCARCDKRFLDEGEYIRHKQEHELKKQFQCEVCDRTFFRSSHLKRHVRTHVSGRANPCDYCGKPFNSIANLRRHLMINHKKTTKHQCQVCGQMILQPSHLEKHIRQHQRPVVSVKEGENIFPEETNPEEKAYKCYLCKKMFKQHVFLKKHLEMHNSKVLYKCGVCEKIYPTMAGMKKHMEVHGDGPFRCFVCSVEFEEYLDYKEHQNAHQPKEEEKKYPCDVCKKRFKYRLSLRKHKKLHNSEETVATNYQCKICSQIYYSRPSLSKHLKTHEVQSLETEGDEGLSQTIHYVLDHSVPISNEMELQNQTVQLLPSNEGTDEVAEIEIPANAVQYFTEEGGEQVLHIAINDIENQISETVQSVQVISYGADGNVEVQEVATGSSKRSESQMATDDSVKRKLHGKTEYQVIETDRQGNPDVLYVALDKFGKEKYQVVASNISNNAEKHAVTDNDKGIRVTSENSQVVARSHQKSTKAHVAVAEGKMISDTSTNYQIVTSSNQMVERHVAVMDTKAAGATPKPVGFKNVQAVTKVPQVKETPDPMTVGKISEGTSDGSEAIESISLVVSTDESGKQYIQLPSEILNKAIKRQSSSAEPMVSTESSSKTHPLDNSSSVETINIIYEDAPAGSEISSTEGLIQLAESALHSEVNGSEQLAETVVIFESPSKASNSDHSYVNVTEDGTQPVLDV
ncbi:zinc finger protein 107-like [Saccostrea cucullata]|uniref:zinc finger protein 107-like n=1 Tax=Saccostrea cuccullata TaxID=36930 RepID=UPI002ED1BA15